MPPRAADGDTGNGAATTGNQYVAFADIGSLRIFLRKKGLAGNPSEPIVSVHVCTDTEMGEEKPEEELMGKRKSSPRFDGIG